jgi:hypothetical protein
MDERARIVDQINRCRQLAEWEKDTTAKAAIERLMRFYESKLALIDAAPGTSGS